MPHPGKEIETLLWFNDNFARELQVRNSLAEEKQAVVGRDEPKQADRTVQNPIEIGVPREP